MRLLPTPVTCALALAVVAAPACSGGSLDGWETPLDSSEAFAGEAATRADSHPVTVAYIDVERTALAAPVESLDAAAALEGVTVGAEIAETDESTRAQALAHFAEVSGEHSQLLEVAGLVRPLPDVGQCVRGTGDQTSLVNSAGATETVADLAETSAGDFELLEAGTVQLYPGSQSVVTLAPRAFPGVSKFNSGVVYTTRDRSASLPGGIDYRIEVTGSPRVAPMTIHGLAPRQLDNVTVNGSPLGQLEALVALRPQDLTWDVGAPGDIVWVDFTVDDASDSVRCVYADEAGAGTVPSVALSQLHGAGRLTLHRLRRVRTAPELNTAAPGTAGVLPQRAELRFDFELARKVRYAETAVVLDETSTQPVTPTLD